MKVAIVGKAGTSAFSPWSDEAWEIWGMPWVIMPRATRLFDLHSQDCWNESVLFTDAKEWIEKGKSGAYSGVPVYCDPSRMAAYETAVEYPLAEVSASLPVPYLENSVAYMLALAIHEKVDEIALCGIHMMGSGEYAIERPSITYLVGLAQGMGIPVHIPPGCPLFISGFNAGRYGQSGGRRF